MKDTIKNYLNKKRKIQEKITLISLLENPANSFPCQENKEVMTESQAIEAVGLMSICSSFSDNSCSA